MSIGISTEDVGVILDSEMFTCDIGIFGMKSKEEILIRIVRNYCEACLLLG